LCEAFKTPNEQAKIEVLVALKLWLTPEAEETVIEAANARNQLLQAKAMILLGNFKTENAAKIAANQLANGRRGASDALKTIGPIAEPYVILLLEKPAAEVRRAAADILGEIGSSKCLPYLQEGLSRAPAEDKRVFEDAIAAVKKRPASEKSGRSGKAIGTPDHGGTPLETRTWRDVTGTHQFEASFVKVYGNRVTLEKTAGKVITLPLSKLSKADQEYVEQRQKNKPENPFE
jgi:hypothetical protein